MQFAASQRGFEYIASVHRAVGFACADHRVQFVDEQDDIAFGFGNVVEDGFEAFFKVATVF
jgi:hypothetical protein